MAYQNTEDFARRRLVKPQSVRARLCREGSYYGAKPIKLPSGRLAWPDDAREQPAEQAAEAAK